MIRNKILLAALAAGLNAFGAATFVIQNNDGAGEGFNDPTPAAPVGGNAGATLGQQRLNAFSHAAGIWGATLTSSVTITIRANFDPLPCSASSAVLGSAGTINAHRDFGGAPFAGTWYNEALANKLAGSDQGVGDPDMQATFNSNLGNAGCLTGTFFYLGLDNNHGANIDLVAVLLHEFRHGLGFASLTNPSTGVYCCTPSQRFPSVYDRFLLDNTAGLTWNNMANATARQNSAINTGNLVWNGSNVIADAPGVIGQGQAVVVTSGLPVNVSGTYTGRQAGFGAAMSFPGVTADLMPVLNQGGGPGCTPFNPVNTAAVAGKIALIDRGTCSFSLKALNAQNAGAIGVIIANNIAGAAPALPYDGTAGVTIPVFSITLNDGNTLKSALAYRSRTRSGVVTTLRISNTTLVTTDANGRPQMYAPNPVEPGSSVSHWNTNLNRNQLMEPFINSDLTHSVVIPRDLTFSLLKDLGW